MKLIEMGQDGNANGRIEAGDVTLGVGDVAVLCDAALTKNNFRSRIRSNHHRWAEVDPGKRMHLPKS